MPSTANWALPYPSANDAPNGATQIGSLATAVDTALESRKTLFVRKTGDTSRNTTTTHADDPTLTLTVAANAVYKVDVALFYVSSSQTAGDFKAQFVGPAGASLQASLVTFAAASTATTDDLTGCVTLTTSMSCGVVATADPYNPCKVDGLLVVGGTGGAFKVQWAQNVSSGTNTTLKAHSYMRLVRVA